MTERYWAVALALTQGVHRAVKEIGHGTFLPTYARAWNDAEGKRYSKEYPLMYGYIFFHTDGKDWQVIKDVDGVYGVLAVGEEAQRVTQVEMDKMLHDHAMGVHNKIAVTPEERRRYGRRRRRPRASRRFRDEARAA